MTATIPHDLMPEIDCRECETVPRNLLPSKWTVHMKVVDSVVVMVNDIDGRERRVKIRAAWDSSDKRIN